METSSTPAPSAHGKLTRRILIGMVLGIIVGLAINLTGFSKDGFVSAHVIGGLFQTVGKIFTSGLSLLVVPLVFVSLVSGTAALDDIKRLGRIGGKTMVLYLLTTAGAISIALTIALIIKPGSSMEMDTDKTFNAPTPPSLWDVIANLVPRNIPEAFTKGEMLQVIVVAILVGLALTLIGAAGKRLLALFSDLNDLVMKLVDLVMLAAPFGVFALVARTFSDQGVTAIGTLFAYFATVVALLLIQGFIVYPGMLAVLARLNPIQHIRNMREVWAVAFSTSSSNATLPVTLEVCQKKIGISSRLSSFIIPLGATINMDGTAIMQGVATVFIAQVYGVELGIGACLTVVLTATLASIGTAGVPGVGLITLTLVLQSVGLPIEGIAMIIGIDRLLDMLRTCVNVTGDTVVATIVAKSENELDIDTYNSSAS